ncbi:MAG: methylmalonyl Co-A mutase-associated GTPase MeaB [Dichotomicrobium sp.]
MGGNDSASGPRRRPALDDYVAGVRRGDRAMLARAITLIESRQKRDRAIAARLLQTLLPDTGGAYRIGLTGSPGAGKSTTIDQLGTNLTAKGHRVAVLAVDPTSQRTGGSILGDKTRMARLAADDRAFIRPSPSAGTLGGVTRTTRETMLLCEAAGFDVIIVETIGVGQSEVAVANMVDFFLVLLLPGAGDDLQGLKKGVLELADMIAVNKADGDNADRARQTANDYRNALHILTPPSPNWRAPVITISGLHNTGLDELWAQVESYRETMTNSGEWDAKRKEQAVAWMHDLIEGRLRAALTDDPAIAEKLAALEKRVRAGDLVPSLAAEEIAAAMGLSALAPGTAEGEA